MIKVPHLLRVHCLCPPLLIPPVILILSVTILPLLSLSLMVKLLRLISRTQSVSASDVHFLEKRGTRSLYWVRAVKTWTPILISQSGIWSVANIYWQWQLRTRWWCWCEWVNEWYLCSRVTGIITGTFLINMKHDRYMPFRVFRNIRYNHYQCSSSIVVKFSWLYLSVWRYSPKHINGAKQWQI